MRLEDQVERQSGKRTDPKRDDFYRDKSRIVHSFSFRRLQGKTQMLGKDESDFHRTRLTHTLEVAQVGFGIVEKLNHKYKDAGELLELLPNYGLIEAICLGHDLGHPPFAHAGERALDFYARGKGGFEGNAQTLRIAGVVDRQSDGYGLDLTRRAMLGLLKYPISRSKAFNYTRQYEKDMKEGVPATTEHLPPALWKAPKCYYDCDQDLVDWMLRPFTEADKTRFQTPKPAEENKHHKAQYKSLDCAIMEFADDIAYGTHDLEDAIALRLVEEKHLEGALPDASVRGKLFDESLLVRHEAIGSLINCYIDAISLEKLGLFLDPLLDTQPVMAEKEKKQLEGIKGVIHTQVIASRPLQTLEYRGEHVLKTIYDALLHSPQRLLGRRQYELYEKLKHRAILDYIAGMTDAYAERLYGRIRSPGSGSVFDRI
jgi:dGTPase